MLQLHTRSDTTVSLQIRRCIFGASFFASVFLSLLLLNLLFLLHIFCFFSCKNLSFFKHGYSASNFYFQVCFSTNLAFLEHLCSHTIFGSQKNPFLSCVRLFLCNPFLQSYSLLMLLFSIPPTEAYCF